jgi:4-amino-4-deoxy-L-arabinose transferase-like glycosyltransferase
MKSKPVWAEGGWTLLLLMMAAFLMRLPDLTNSLWHDETWYTFIFLNSNNLRNVLFHDVHPPLYPLIMVAWVGLVGDGELAVRLPSLLFGLASIFLMFAVTRICFDRKTALLAAALMALSPVHIWYSHETKNNMLLMLLTLVTCYWLLRAWGEDRPRNWIWFTVSALLSLWTNAFALWMVSAMFLWLLLQVLRKAGRDRLRAVLMSAAGVGLGWLPFVWIAAAQMGALKRDYLRPFTLADAFSLFFIYLSHGNTLRTISPYQPLSQIWTQPHWLFLVESFYLLLIVAGLWSWGRTRQENSSRPAVDRLSQRPKNELLLLYLLLPPLLVAAASLIYRNLYIERSMIILLPPLLLLIACGVRVWRAVVWRNVLLAVLLLFNGWALFNLWVGKADTWTVYKQNPDWKSAARYFADELSRSNVPVFILHTAPGEALDYSYGRLLKSDVRSIAGILPASLPHSIVNQFDQAVLVSFMKTNRIGTVYLIHELTWSLNFGGLLKTIQASSYFRADGQVGFKELEIFKFRIQSGSAIDDVN